MLRNLTIATRITVLLAAVAVLLMLMATGFYFAADSISHAGADTARQIFVDAGKTRLKSIIHSTAIALGDLTAEAPDDEAKLAVIAKAIENARFEEDHSGYFYVYKGTVNAAHPTQKQLVGRDLSETRDVNGVAYVRELARAVASGGGFVEFVFPKPGQGDVPKLGYAEAIPGTPYWIGTGVYIDNLAEAERRISSEMESIKRYQLGLTFSGVLIALLIFGLPLAVAITRSIVIPLRQATDMAGQIAAGRLDVSLKAHGRDEIAALHSALDIMVGKLRDNIEAIRSKEAETAGQAEAARESARRADAMAREAVESRRKVMAVAEELEELVARLGDASQGLTSLSGYISDGTRLQVGRVSETATAMDQMNSTVAEVASSAAKAASETQTSRDKAREGAASVTGTVSAMNDLRRLAGGLVSNMQRLGEQSEAIGRVMVVISDIADQTNLLALNAAIEAARAGEAGRGFAVVADEVRKLAEKTMSATKEVGDTIRGIQDLSKTNMQSMDGAMLAIEKAAVSSRESGDQLQGILVMTDTCAAQVQAIAAAAEEQSAASEHIARSLEDIANAAKSNGELVSEVDGDIRNLAGMAEALRKLIGEMRHS